MLMSNFAYLLLVISGTCSALASFSLKYAATVDKTAGVLLGPLTLKIAAVGFYGVGFLFYAWSLKKLPLSTAYPVMVAVTIVEVFLFGMLTGERIWYGNILGAALIAGGVALIVH